MDEGSEKKEPVTNSQTVASDFAARYRQQMKQQMEKVNEERRAAATRAAHKEARRKEKEKLRALRNAKREEEKRRRQQLEEARRQQKLERSREAQKKKQIRAEVRRQKRIANKTAEMGGGVVNLHGTQISTEVQPVRRFSLRDLLGITPRYKLKAAETEKEKQALQEKQEAITEDARQAASHLTRVKANRFRNSGFGRAMHRIGTFSEIHKKGLLFALGLAILVTVAFAGFINYYTLYEYKYNGQVLGYVKNKDDVLRITELVQTALTEDKGVEVVIRQNEDIEFKRVSNLKKRKTADSSDEVLKRLTYMGDLNVKAWGIFVDDRKVGSVQKKSDAAEVLKQLEDRYASHRKGSVIEKAEIQEKIEFHKRNTDLSKVYSVDEMTDRLCTSGKKESRHTIVAGETLNDIAKEYQTTEENILKDNKGVDPRKLVVGDTLFISQNAPVVTVRITEKRSYDKTIKYETEERKTDEMYEGEEEIEQEGHNGKEHLVERSLSINGVIDKENIKVLDRKVRKKARKKIVLIGTAERPPSVGDGVYIWPMAGGYTISSGFGHRWGRLHAGIDMATPVGNDVLAADGGIVTRSGYFGGYGYCVDVDHQNGQSTRYAHLSSSLVNAGDEVYEGQHIAESGNTGRSTGAHLHFEIRINGAPQNPMDYLPQ